MGTRDVSAILAQLIGKKLEQKIAVHDYVQLYLSGGIIINIYNAFTLNPTNAVLEGETCTEVEQSEETIRFSFSTGVSLAVDLRPAAYSGPEALKLNIPGEPTVVWN